MKKVFLAVALLGVVACNNNKIAYVDNVKLMDEFDEKIELEAKFTAQMEVFGAKRDSISQAFQQEAQAFQQQADKMNTAKAQEMYAVLQQKGQAIGQQLQQEEQAIQQASQTEMDAVVEKVKAAINAYGEANGYTFILGGGEGGSVLYGAPANNVTEAIVTELNKEAKE